MENKSKRKNILKKYKRIVIKIGTNVISDKGSPNKERMESIIKNINDLIKDNKEIILVTSGAIGLGANILLPKGITPKSIPMKQACASVGQPLLMEYYKNIFRKYNYIVSQILLTNDILKFNQAFKNAHNTMMTLIERKCIPIVNENDTVSVEEIKFGDNDKLAAVVSLIIGADICILLSDIDGFYLNYKDKEKRKRISFIENITDEIFEEAGLNDNPYSTGGMKSKLIAGKTLNSTGIDMAILSGKINNTLIDFFNGEDIGTIFISKKDSLSPTRRWLKEFANSEGNIYVDEGAYLALTTKGKSLLPSGISAVKGTFDSGDVVSIFFEEKEFAKGITWFSSDDILKIKGKKSSEIANILGINEYNEVIHRNNLLIYE